MKPLTRVLAASAAALALATAAAPADAGGYRYGGGYHGGGRYYGGGYWRGGVTIGIAPYWGWGAPYYAGYYGPRYYYPGYTPATTRATSTDRSTRRAQSVPQTYVERDDVATAPPPPQAPAPAPAQSQNGGNWWYWCAGSRNYYRTSRNARAAGSACRRSRPTERRPRPGFPRHHHAAPAQTLCCPPGPGPDRLRDRSRRSVAGRDAGTRQVVRGVPVRRFDVPRLRAQPDRRRVGLAERQQRRCRHHGGGHRDRRCGRRGDRRQQQRGRCRRRHGRAHRRDDRHRYGPGSYYGTQRRYDAAYHQCMYAKGNKVPVAANYTSRTTQYPSSASYPPPAAYPPRPTVRTRRRPTACIRRPTCRRARIRRRTRRRRATDSRGDIPRRAPSGARFIARVGFGR